MRAIKKLLALLLAAAILAVLAGCSGPAETIEVTNPPEISETPTDRQEKKRVLSCTVSLEGGLSIFDELLRPAVEEYGYAYDCISCDGDAVKQIEQVENGVAQGYDLIFLYAVTGEALSDACAHAMDAGVYVYTFLNDTVNHDVLFCDDPVANGRLLGEMSLQWVSETFPDAQPGSVNAAILGCSNDSYNVAFSNRRIHLPQ